ncbi:hypothetical protein Y032_0010g1094 [Ancylostoma ceylanicum]|uniref:Uncharacterized protein n=1 Tax=Ancylostoma ceylanicum TaxID=53326 RepID=A0A016VGA1_9BILA|nr:hypothetical protein Y032_0010g1094 [Ancylostoma ceylanicum]
MERKIPQIRLRDRIRVKKSGNAPRLTHSRQCAQPVDMHGAKRGSKCLTGWAQTRAQGTARVSRGIPLQERKVANVLEMLTTMRREEN